MYRKYNKKTFRRITDRLKNHTRKLIFVSFFAYFLALIGIILYGLISSEALLHLCALFIISFTMTGAVFSGLANLFSLFRAPESDQIDENELSQLEKELEICYHSDED